MTSNSVTTSFSSEGPQTQTRIPGCTAHDTLFETFFKTPEAVRMQEASYMGSVTHLPSLDGGFTDDHKIDVYQWADAKKRQVLCSVYGPKPFDFFQMPVSTFHPIPPRNRFSQLPREFLLMNYEFPCLGKIDMNDEEFTHEADYEFRFAIFYMRGDKKAHLWRSLFMNPVHWDFLGEHAGHYMETILQECRSSRAFDKGVSRTVKKLAKLLKEVEE